MTTAEDRMKALQATQQQAQLDAVFAGLTEEAATYLGRLFELSPGHHQPHDPVKGCECEWADAPSRGDKLEWIDEGCRQMQALLIRVRADRIRNARQYERYTPEPGFRLEILRETVLLMASGHIGSKEAWVKLVKTLGIRQNTDEVNIIEQALTELRGVEAPAVLRWPHGERHPRQGFARKGALGTVCDGARCGGRGDNDTESMLAVFEADFRAHVATDDIYAVAKDGLQVGRAVMAVDGKATSQFGSIITASAYEKLGDAVGPQKVTNTATLIRGQATRVTTAEGTEKHVLPVRATVHGAGYLIDLGQGQYVEVDEQGWRVTEWRPEYPVMLASTRALPVPVSPNGVDPRLAHLGFTADDPNWHQIRMWQATAFFADHERQLMMLTGGSGSGKTKRAQSIAAIVDPLAEDAHGRPVMGGPLPDDEALAPELLRNYLFTSDNLTNLDEEESDRLCRIATGYRFTRRVLYTTADTYSVVVLRAGLLTGIDVPPQLREDAQNRLLHLELDTSATKRASHDLDQERREIGPLMLGALLDDMVTVLQAFRRGEFDAHDRFPIVACAAQAFGPDYVESRAGRQRELAKQRAEGDTMLAAVAQVVKHAGIGQNPTLRLTVQELYDAVKATLPDGRLPKGWATSAQGLRVRIGRNLGTLSAFGVTRDNGREKGRAGQRYIELVYLPGTERADVPDPLPDDFEEMGVHRPAPRGPFLGPNAAATYRRVRQLTEQRGDPIA